MVIHFNDCLTRCSLDKSFQAGNELSSDLGDCTGHQEDMKPKPSSGELRQEQQMNLEISLEILLLFSLGLCGWVLFRMFRVPMAPFLGTVAVIGLLRCVQVDLPTAPDNFTIFIQLVLGLYTGSRVTRETVWHLKGMVIPAMIVVVWSLSVAFGLGAVLAIFTNLDLYTAILSSSMSGLPEMTMIALDLKLDVSVVIVMHLFRIVLTTTSFPVILSLWLRSGDSKKRTRKETTLFQQNHPQKTQDGYAQQKIPIGLFSQLNQMKELWRRCCLYLRDLFCSFKRIKVDASSVRGILLTFIIAFVGGIIFMFLKVPAGAMVGSTLAIASTSILGFRIKTPPPFLFNFVIIGAGIIVSNNISSQAVDTIISGELLLPIIISAVFIYSCSLLIALLISRIAKWDFPTSLLAAAPGGITLMPALAIAYGKDPLRVSVLHLCRLITLKAVLPIVFRSML